jgi:23S rRNA pseudouridine1911/1915/1917 synthase
MTVQVSDAEAGQRLDRLLAARLELPRNQIQRWIRAGRVTLDERAVKASHPVTAGESFVCRPLPRELERDLEPEPEELVVLYQDAEIVVLDKPAGLVVHPGAGRRQGTLAHRLVAHYPEMADVGGPGRPGIVHRLDKDTTGVMVVARSQRAYQRLSTAFAERRVDKRYLALVFGEPAARQGRIQQPVGRHPRRRQQMAVHARGRPALTDYRRIRSAAGVSLLELELATGRTHQIRVHLKALGHPLIGDPVYGEMRWKSMRRSAREPLRRFARPALHAWRLRLEHPTTGESQEFEAPPALDLQALWRAVTGDDFPDLPRT